MVSDKYSTTIKDLPTDERPRERLARYGPEALSPAELLAILLRTGTRERSAIDLAQHLIAKFDGLKGVGEASIERLAEVHGIGPAKAIQIKAAIELGKRVSVSENNKRAIRSPEDVFTLVGPRLHGDKQEHFIGVFLDTRNQVIRDEYITTGGLDSSLIHPRELFKRAVDYVCSSVIVCHNHPSGDPTPSQEDVDVTRRLVEAGKIVGIDVLDHVVVGDGRWISLKDRGLM